MIMHITKIKNQSAVRPSTSEQQPTQGASAGFY